jgi:hypothetical protein
MIHAAAVRYEMSIEVNDRAPGSAAYKCPVKAPDALEVKLLRRGGDRILARPVKSWADVVLLTELAAAHDARTTGGVRERGR